MEIRQQTRRRQHAFSVLKRAARGYSDRYIREGIQISTRRAMAVPIPKSSPIHTYWVVLRVAPSPRHVSILQLMMARWPESCCPKHLLAHGASVFRRVARMCLNLLPNRRDDRAQAMMSTGGTRRPDWTSAALVCMREAIDGARVKCGSSHSAVTHTHPP